MSQADKVKSNYRPSFSNLFRKACVEISGHACRYTGEQTGRQAGSQEKGPDNRNDKEQAGRVLVGSFCMTDEGEWKQLREGGVGQLSAE